MPVPDVSYKVEIAWTSNWLTPATSRTWTDVSAYVELDRGMSISYGRTDEISSADANTLTLTLDNKDGRFTWGNASSPYYPNIKIGKPIRVTATVGGVDYVRFVGYINEWPVEWPGDSAGFAQTALSASSRLARLDLATAVHVAVDQEIMTTGSGSTLSNYWPMVEPEGAARAENLVNAAAPLLPTRASGVIFGMGAADDSVAEFVLADQRGGIKLVSTTTGQSGGMIGTELPGTDTNVIGAGTPGGATYSFAFRNLGPFGTGLPASTTFASFSYNKVAFALDRVVFTLPGVAAQTIMYPTSLLDNAGSTHLTATIACDGVNHTLTLYVNGNAAGSSSVAAVGTFDAAGGIVRFDQPSNTTLYRDVFVGRVAIWREALTSAMVFGVSEACFWGYQFQSVNARLIRNARWARLPAAEVVTLPVGGSGRGLADDAAATDRKFVDLFRELENAEAGIFYEDRTGNLVLQIRGSRYNAPVALTLNMTTDLVRGFAPKADRQNLANVGKATGPTGAEVTYTDETSRLEYGDAEYTVETIALGVDEPLDRVAWHVNGYSQPRPRIPAPTISVIDYLSSVGPVMALDVSSLVLISNAPAQAPSTVSGYFVEGYSEEMGPGIWTLTPNLTPSAPDGDVLVLDSATEGVLNTNILAL